MQLESNIKNKFKKGVSHLKRWLLVLCVVALTFSMLINVNARLVDLRTNKTPEADVEVFFDNLPNLNDGAYSGIYVGDVVKISGKNSGGADLKIVFPSGVNVDLPITNKTINSFDKTIVFDEEGIYQILPINKTFEVCYRVKVIPPVKLLKNIVGERPSNDDYDKTFINYNNAVAIEKVDMVPSVSFVVLDKNGNPIPNLVAKKFKTNEFGIATIPIDQNSSAIYGDLRCVQYKRFAFDRTGHFIHTSNEKKLKDGFVDNGHLFIDAKEFLAALSISSVDANKFEIGDKYVMYENRPAFPAIISEKDGVKYVDAESVLTSIDTRTLGIFGTAIDYQSDNIVIYVACSAEE